MAFVTGVVLISGCVALILKYATSLDMEPLTGYLWVAHGWLYLVYVIVTAMLGLQAALAAGPLRAGDAGRHDPDDVVRRRALRHPRSTPRGRLSPSRSATERRPYRRRGRRGPGPRASGSSRPGTSTRPPPRRRTARPPG